MTAPAARRPDARTGQPDHAPVGGRPSATAALRAARASLTVGQEDAVAALRRLDGRRRAAEIGFFVALWAAGALLAVGAPDGPLGWARYLLGVAASAVALNGGVLLMHEGMHQLLFRSRRANAVASTLLGCLAGVSFAAYRLLHILHHVYLGDPRDPDDYGWETAPRRAALLNCVRIAAGSYLYILLIPFVAWPHARPGVRRAIARDYALQALLIAGAVALLPWPALRDGWLVPLLVVGLMTNVRGLAEHTLADGHTPWTASRTMTVHPALAFCLLNITYHAEHHLFPEVPSYHLPALSRLVGPRMPAATVESSYLGFVARFLWRTLRGQHEPLPPRTSPGAAPTGGAA